MTCYSLQNHLRTTVPSIGQVETDEIYVGLDRRGAHYILPIQAKAGPYSEMAQYSLLRADWSPRQAYVVVRDMPK